MTTSSSDLLTPEVKRPKLGLAGIVALLGLAAILVSVLTRRQFLDPDTYHLLALARLTVEQGWVDENGLVLLALTVFAGLVTIGAAGIATGLAQADAEADLKTLAAVGAPPSVRRMLSGFQCGLVAAMGVVLGSAAGVLKGIGNKNGPLVVEIPQPGTEKIKVDSRSKMTN